MIRNRLVQFQGGDTQIAADSTAVALTGIVMPSPGKIKSITGWIGTKTGSNAAQLDVFKSGAAGSSAAASTTSCLSAAMDMTSDAIITGTLSTTLSAINFIAGEVLYLKVTTGATTSIDDYSVTVVVDY